MRDIRFPVSPADVSLKRPEPGSRHRQNFLGPKESNRLPGSCRSHTGVSLEWRTKRRGEDGTRGSRNTGRAAPQLLLQRFRASPIRSAPAAKRGIAHRSVLEAKRLRAQRAARTALAPRLRPSRDGSQDARQPGFRPRSPRPKTDCRGKAPQAERR